MNIKVVDSWLKDYIKTKASPEEIAKALSLHSFSVEKIDYVNDDAVYEVEVTPNRGDALSIMGIARELNVVLPKMNIECSWIERKIIESAPGTNTYKLDVVIKNPTLVPRFSAVILDNVKVSESTEVIKTRLEKVGIRALGNVIDVTNYMMIDRGQPMHAFDYDKILEHKMIVRESLEGETIQTLDGVTRTLPEGVIVIEDGSGRLIDLCGIMGAKNSEVDDGTKRVLLFVQVYDAQRIRRASMSLGHRTDAALRFEKGIDYNGVIPALWDAVSMVHELSGSELASELIDIKNAAPEVKTVKIDYGVINRIAGTELTKEYINQALESLGFKITGDMVEVPSWRYDDITLPEDLAEEVVRIYGYYNIPNELPVGAPPSTYEDISFKWEAVTKDYLKYIGFFECYTYSATNQNMAGSGAIHLKNPLNEEFEYLKTSLVPQLMDVMNRNQGYSEKIKIYELSNVYLNKPGDLPNQPLHLALVTKGITYLEFKGYLEGLCDILGIKRYPVFKITEKGVYTICELDFSELVSHASDSKSYIPLTQFNFIREDFTFEVPTGISYEQISNLMCSLDVRISRVTFKDLYENFLTFTVEFLDRTQQISSEQVKEVRTKMLSELDKEFGVKIKS